MTLGEMGVEGDEGGTFVPQCPGNLAQARTAHRQVRRERMAQVVEALFWSCTGRPGKSNRKQERLDGNKRSPYPFLHITLTTCRHNIVRRMVAALHERRDMVLGQTTLPPLAAIHAPMIIRCLHFLPLRKREIRNGGTFFPRPPPLRMSKMRRSICRIEATPSLAYFFRIGFFIGVNSRTNDRTFLGIARSIIRLFFRFLLRSIVGEKIPAALRFVGPLVVPPLLFEMVTIPGAKISIIALLP